MTIKRVFTCGENGIFRRAITYLFNQHNKSYRDIAIHVQ